MTTSQLQLETLFSPLHCPTMIRGKQWFHDEREIAQQWFLRANSPVIDNTDPLTLLRKRPLATALKIAMGLQCKTIGTNVSHRKIPAQCIRQPALSIKVHHFPKPTFIAALSVFT